MTSVLVIAFALAVLALAGVMTVVGSPRSGRAASERDEESVRRSAHAIAVAVVGLLVLIAAIFAVGFTDWMEGDVRPDAPSPPSEDAPVAMRACYIVGKMGSHLLDARFDAVADGAEQLRDLQLGQVSEERLRRALIDARGVGAPIEAPNGIQYFAEDVLAVLSEAQNECKVAGYM